MAQAVVVQNAARSGDLPSLEAYFPRGSDQDSKHLTTKGCWPSSFSGVAAVPTSVDVQ